MRILGLEFFDGTAAQAVDRAVGQHGLIVAPSGTCFQRLQHDAAYRHAMTQADLILPDSGFMVLLWRWLRGQQLTRISGLAYLQELLRRDDLRREHSVVWVLPDDTAAETTLSWLQSHDFPTIADDIYVAPIYGRQVEDSALAERIRSRSPEHVVIALSGGVQEKLGFFVRENSAGRPAIHCIGAALGFITGYQVAIPGWADRLYLGWFLRLLADPLRFFPRARNAFGLPGLVKRYGETLPPLRDPARETP